MNEHPLWKVVIHWITDNVKSVYHCYRMDLKYLFFKIIIRSQHCYSRSCSTWSFVYCGSNNDFDYKKCLSIGGGADVWLQMQTTFFGAELLLFKGELEQMCI